MRIALVLCVLAAVVGCGASAAAPAEEPAATDLRITVWPEGRGQGPSEGHSIKCTPARGSLPRAATACTKLLRMSNPFKPVPRDAICTEQYGGPQQALVTGTFKGRRIWAMFSATNGCQIARSRAVAFLLPGFDGAAGA